MRVLYFSNNNWSGIWHYYKGFMDPDWKVNKIWLAQLRVSLFTSAKTEVRVQISEFWFTDQLCLFADHIKSNESKHSFCENLGKPQCFCLLFKLHNLLMHYFKKYCTLFSCIWTFLSPFPQLGNLQCPSHSNH